MGLSISFLKFVYHNAEVGIIEINDMLYKVKNVKLERELKKEKRNFEKIKSKCLRCFNKYKCKPNNISLMAKMSSEFFSQLRLTKDNCDKLIIKTLIETYYKGLENINYKILENNCVNYEVIKIAEELFRNIKDNIKQLKKFYKFC